MRLALDSLYRASGALAAVFLAAIAIIVLAQVGANVIDALAGWLTGAPIGLVIPSYAEVAGFFLAASSFLALAYTLRAGGHIRVTLLLQHAHGRRRLWAEAWCAFAGALMAAYFSWYAVGLTLESLHFGDVSTGMVPVPLWIPQAAMALGLIVLTVAMVDELVHVVRGGAPAGERQAAQDGE